MNIKTGAKNLEEPKTLKVTIPVGMHLRLHSLKILQGKNLSRTVEEALDAYFDEPTMEASSGP